LKYLYMTKCLVTQEKDFTGLFLTACKYTQTVASQSIYRTQWGTIHLCEPLGAGYVTHEFTHALFHYMDIVDEDEEHYCDAIGKAVAEFWDMYYYDDD